MNELKKLDEWERQKGYLVRRLSDPEVMMTEEEFNAIPFSDLHGVDHEMRTKFLIDNGYEVTRENMIADLSAKPPAEVESDVLK